MTIKSLLLGSTAALMAVTTAQAADAIVVEPEPVEYVRVCDAYGSGFFFIPGTETCMRISGYVRTTYATDHRDLEIDDWRAVGGGRNAVAAETDIDDDRHRWNYRGRLNIDVRNETEYGTLRSQLRFQGGDTNQQDASVAIDRALISLAGFNLGYSDNYWATNHGYGVGTPAVNDLFYGYDQAIFFDYTWAQDGLAVTVGVQDSSSNSGSFDGTYGAAYADFYAGLNYSADFGTFAFTALHDSNASDEDGDLGVWGYKASIQLDLSEFIPGGQFGAFYMAADEPTHQNFGAYGLLTNTAYTGAGLSFDSTWGVTLKGNLADNLTGYIGYSQADLDTDRLFNTASGQQYDVDETSDLFNVGVVWAPVTGLTIQAEYARLSNDLHIRESFAKARFRPGLFFWSFQHRQFVANQCRWPRFQLRNVGIGRPDLSYI